MNNLFQPLDPAADRSVRLKMLKDYYLQYLCEDNLDGTPLDLEILRFIEGLESKYTPDLENYSSFRRNPDKYIH
jgi:hypothetical protein